MISMQRIQAVADQIGRQFRPEKVILFGSYAYGTPTEDSDVDLLVVMPADRRDRRRSVEIQSALTESFPMDLLVYDPEYLRRRAQMEDWFVREIVEQGRVRYEAGVS